MAQGAFPNQLASGITQIAGEDPFHLFAGDSKTVTGQGEFGEDVAIFTPIARQTADGKLYAWDPAAADGTENALFITAQAVDVSEQAVGPYYEGGYFNHEALNWPAAIDTLAERKAAFDGTPISIGKLL